MKKKSILIIVLIIIIGFIACGYFYLSDYYHATDYAMGYINGTDNVTVTESDYGLFLDGPGNNSALIFYPGLKVEYTSYLPILTNLSENGVDCFLVKMPFNVAVFGKDKAGEIINNYKYDHYFLAGHSLGGSVAADYACQSDKIDGLILLGSNPSEKINKPVLAIHGSEDKVLTFFNDKETPHVQGDNVSEITINGGNHAQFGDYGKQPVDGEAKISSQEQQALTVKEIIEFIKALS